MIYCLNKDTLESFFFEGLMEWSTGNDKMMVVGQGLK